MPIYYHSIRPLRLSHHFVDMYLTWYSSSDPQGNCNVCVSIVNLFSLIELSLVGMRSIAMHSGIDYTLTAFCEDRYSGKLSLRTLGILSLSASIT